MVSMPAFVCVRSTHPALMEQPLTGKVSLVAVQCALFDKLVKEREEASKVSTFVGGGQCVVGEDVMTSAQLAAAQAAREAAQHTCQQEEEKAATHR